jgi:short chain dehydrogenase
MAAIRNAIKAAGVEFTDGKRPRRPGVSRSGLMRRRLILVFIAAAPILVFIAAAPLVCLAESLSVSPQKAVLVTGASSGIGRKITERLAADGYFVYAGARKEEDLKALGAIKNVQAIRLDVTSTQDIDNVVAAAGGEAALTAVCEIEEQSGRCRRTYSRPRRPIDPGSSRAEAVTGFRSQDPRR